MRENKVRGVYVVQLKPYGVPFSAAPPRDGRLPLSLRQNLRSREAEAKNGRANNCFVLLNGAEKFIERIFSQTLPAPAAGFV